MKPFHYVFDKLYPVIRFVHEKVRGNNWFDEITPKLWLGGAPSEPRDLQFLLDNGINAVVNIRAEREDDLAFYAKHDITHIQLKVFDMDVASAEQLEQGVQFTHQALEAGRSVLIHCAKGRGRSANVMAAYYMRYHGKTFDEAVALMTSRRSLVKQESRHKAISEQWAAEYP